MSKKRKILFVCMGNICRSPTAEAVFTHLAEQAGVADQLVIDSAGTHSYHIGSPPDARSQAAAKLRGYEMSHLKARKVIVKDFEEFDYVVAMDRDNMENLMQLCPAGYDERLSLLLQYSGLKTLDVPDPYYGGERGFDEVLDLIEKGAQGLLAEVLKELGD